MHIKYCTKGIRKNMHIKNIDLHTYVHTPEWYSSQLVYPILWCMYVGLYGNNHHKTTVIIDSDIGK